MNFTNASMGISFLLDLPSTVSQMKKVCFRHRHFTIVNSISDYKNFQTMIAGKTNVSNAETLTISNSGGGIISDSQVLQIWDSKGTRTIRFFRNATDGMFSECKIAGLKPYYSKKKELKLEFRNGYDFDNFKKLKIVFMSESARDKFERLAQFSKG